MRSWKIVVAIGFVLSLSMTACLPTTKTPPPTSVTITYPTDQAEVDLKEAVQGESQMIPDEQTIWVFVFPHESNCYYPVGRRADIEAGSGEWSSMAYIGTEENVGEKFDLLAVLADKKAQATIEAYIKESENKETWPGMEKLPEGVSIYDRVTVKRR